VNSPLYDAFKQVCVDLLFIENNYGKKLRKGTKDNNNTKDNKHPMPTGQHDGIKQKLFSSSTYFCEPREKTNRGYARTNLIPFTT
jgi:hypothetical protein